MRIHELSLVHNSMRSRFAHRYLGVEMACSCHSQGCTLTFLARNQGIIHQCPLHRCFSGSDIEMLESITEGVNTRRNRNACILLHFSPTEATLFETLWSQYIGLGSKLYTGMRTVTLSSGIIVNGAGTIVFLNFNHQQPAVRLYGGVNNHAELMSRCPARLRLIGSGSCLCGDQPQQHKPENPKNDSSRI
ncbi:hypothetical protein BO82DRAFT_95837 [Aspergillus uvarum CBS 121591]|uniref:Uncharacterized protein n=1 Tax=Aspergillus uvarum CBS 121591 TaxID=1448315 RepID=A0A319CA89_9EURO|nr:hypothetical protein BO82DRAFT_95837 [Aspergillus uvarum CBS 121591]PYH81150.1 hypothetical protein BO82DRAFT_95837 [Aspergillus uvarum CBS 121591]